MLDKIGVYLWIAGQFIDNVKSLKSIASVEDAWIESNRSRFGFLIVNKEDASSKRTIDCRTTNDDWEVEFAFIQFLHT